MSKLLHRHVTYVTWGVIIPIVRGEGGNDDKYHNLLSLGKMVCTLENEKECFSQQFIGLFIIYFLYKNNDDIVRWGRGSEG